MRKTGTHKQSDDVKRFRRAFRTFNEKCFDGSLEPVKIVCGRNAPGRPAWSEACTTILPSGEVIIYIKKPKDDNSQGALLHEMVHLDLIQKKVPHAHDDTFLSRCNEVAAILGLPAITDTRLAGTWPETARMLHYYPNVVPVFDCDYDPEYLAMEQEQLADMMERFGNARTAA